MRYFNSLTLRYCGRGMRNNGTAPMVNEARSGTGIVQYLPRYDAVQGDREGTGPGAPLCRHHPVCPSPPSLFIVIADDNAPAHHRLPKQQAAHHSFGNRMTLGPVRHLRDRRSGSSHGQQLRLNQAGLVRPVGERRGWKFRRGKPPRFCRAVLSRY